jgi:hypothetical protein
MVDFLRLSKTWLWSSAPLASVWQCPGCLLAHARTLPRFPVNLPRDAKVDLSKSTSVKSAPRQPANNRICMDIRPGSMLRARLKDPRTPIISSAALFGFVAIVIQFTQNRLTIFPRTAILPIFLHKPIPGRSHRYFYLCDTGTCTEHGAVCACVCVTVCVYTYMYGVPIFGYTTSSTCYSCAL